ncbi:hypothetical protein DK412_21015 [Methylobacterium sp. 17Sr1-1]|nr:hypothetical protein DK412_21015 [Methylobacterium sp. 17Sr1-1]
MRTAVYVRVSTARQAKAQTIDQQLDRLRVHLQAQSTTSDDSAIFRDDGRSGAMPNRPGCTHPIFFPGQPCAGGERDCARPEV